jgi:hypothetical protein
MAKERTMTNTRIFEGLKALNPDGCFEVRAFDCDGNATFRKFGPGTWGSAADYASMLDSSRRWTGVYATFNPLQPASEGGAKNEHVERRRLLYLDIDPHRISPHGEILSGIPATDAEVAAAKRMLFADVLPFLASRGWPDPLVTFTGNGCAAYYPIDLPNDEKSEQLVSRVLGGLAQKLDCADATIDRSVCNAARITRIPGTWNRKAERTRERPHRQSGILLLPSHGVVVDVAELNRLADELMPVVPIKPKAFRGAATWGLMPGVDFDRNGPAFDQILAPFHWTLVRGTPDDGYWRRPGKTWGISATTKCRGHAGEPLLFVWSTNATPFEEKGCYGKFRALAHLECGGDLYAMASRLYQKGFGERIGRPNRSAQPIHKPMSPIEKCLS